MVLALPGGTSARNAVRDIVWHQTICPQTHSGNLAALSITRPFPARLRFHQQWLTHDSPVGQGDQKDHEIGDNRH